MIPIERLENIKEKIENMNNSYQIEILKLLVQEKAIISENNKQFSIILTKIDKCASSFIIQQKESLISLLKNYGSHFNCILSSSSSKNIGIVDIQKEIFNLTKLS